MRTSTWKPAAPGGLETPGTQLGLTQRFRVTTVGAPASEVSAVAALYLALNYTRQEVRFTVTTLEGDEVAYNQGGKLTGDPDFLEALYLLEQSMLIERRQAVNQALDNLAERTGISLPQSSAEGFNADESAAEGSHEHTPRSERNNQGGNRRRR